MIEIKSDFKDYIDVFLEENSKRNLISHNDEKFLYEKHIYDSLCIKLFFDKYGINCTSLLDIGCGGGFPCVPIAMEYPNLRVTGIDSIKKKIDSVENIKNKLGLCNLNLICDRVENLKNSEFDIVVSRAVANLLKVSQYALPILQSGGYFIAYKSKKADEEIANVQDCLKQYNSKIVDVIEYALPTEEHYERKLICIKKVKG